MRAVREHGYCNIALGTEIIGRILADGTWRPALKIVSPTDAP